jgi:hypothetical protein
MGTCEMVPICVFFNDRMANMPLVSELLKQRHCLNDFTSCARFIVKNSGKPVPDDLFPEDTDRAKRIVGS